MNRLLLYDNILVEFLKGVRATESASLGRNCNSVHLLSRRMLLYITIMRTSDEVDIHQPLQCGELSLNKSHSMPPKTGSRGHIQPSQGQQKGPREQVPAVVAPHWGYCTDFAASPLQSGGRRGGQVTQIVCKQCKYYAHIIHEYTRQVEELHVQCARKQETRRR